MHQLSGDPWWWRRRRAVALLGVVCLCGACSLTVDLHGPAARSGDAALDGGARDARVTDGRSPGPREDAGQPVDVVPDAGHVGDATGPADGTVSPRADASPDAAPDPDGAPPDPCGPEGCRWDLGEWTDCPVTCGEAERRRDVRCVDGEGLPADPARCPAPSPATVETIDCTVPEDHTACVDDAVWWFDGCGEPARQWFTCARRGGCREARCQCGDAPRRHICCWSPEIYERFGGCTSLEADLVRRQVCPNGPEDVSDAWFEANCPD